MLRIVMVVLWTSYEMLRIVMIGCAKFRVDAGAIRIRSVGGG